MIPDNVSLSSLVSSHSQNPYKRKGERANCGKLSSDLYMHPIMHMHTHIIIIIMITVFKEVCAHSTTFPSFYMSFFLC